MSREDKAVSENLKSVLNAARRLPIEQQRQLALQLLDEMAQTGGQEEREASTTGGSIRRHFGTWDSGDPHSADNERIDEDLAREYGSAQQV